ncbi:GPO family capsid scaffolding protein [Burkholderia ambifaria]|uniref:GPO family capsid scaffolding protein n=1 Tax=Burkholderia ambifaria TaxID=152480 RepID=UPI001FC80072|nr:GPO family capsid scaffolding protein [Burkholderia ambifaria]
MVGGFEHPARVGRRARAITPNALYPRAQRTPLVERATLNAEYENHAQSTTVRNLSMPKSKFFRVAVAGATIDGREIKPEWLTQMAKNYDRNLYGARVNLEHVRGVTPLSATTPFGSYGDVIALDARVIDDGPLKGKMALFAQIDPTDDMVALSKKRQKIYSSIEVNPSFADTGEAYLVGIAATDTPASLGTEAIQFAALRSSNLFSEAHETTIDFESTQEPGGRSLLAHVKSMFANSRTGDEKRLQEIQSAVEEVAKFASEQSGELRTALANAEQRATAAEKSAADALSAVEKLTETLAATDKSQTFRPKSTGGSGETVTDC